MTTVQVPRSTAAPAPERVADATWVLQRRLCVECDPRLFPALGFLDWSATGSTAGATYVVARTGFVGAEVRLDHIDKRPGADAGVSRATQMGGAWPHWAWARLAVSGTHPSYEHTSYGAVQLDAWEGLSWRTVVDLDDRGGTFLEAVPWGPSGALVIGLGYYLLAGRELCSSVQELIGSSPTPPPQVLSPTCDFFPEAIGTSPSFDLFVAGTAFALEEFDDDPTPHHPLEVRRWRGGAGTFERDDLEAGVGYAPRTIDTGEHNTLLVVGATDAYLAVMTPKPSEHVVVLRFDGRTWSEVLRTPPPWAGIERGDDGSVWLVSGDALYVQALPPEPPGFRRVPDGTARGADDREHAIVPQHVMPWSATRASVIGRYAEEIALFTVTTPGARLARARPE